MLVALVQALSCPLFAQIDSFDKTYDNLGNALPTEYSALDSNSLVLSGLTGKKTWCAWNGAGGKACMAVAGSSEVPASGDKHEVCIPPSAGRCVSTEGASRLFLRSATGSDQTSGNIYGDSE